MTPPTTAISMKGNRGKTVPGRMDRAVVILALSAALPAALGLLLALWRERQVPFILLLDVFDLQFVTQEVTASVVVLAIAGAAFWLTSRQEIRGQHAVLESLWRRVWLVAVSVFAFCVAGTLSITQMSTVSGDEYANLLQAGIFASGMKTGDLFGHWPAQLAHLMVPGELGNRILVDATGRVITSYQPVFSLIAAPFEALGVRFLFNPLVAAAVVWITGSCVWRLTRSDWMAGLAVLLMASSASVTGFGMSFFNSNLILLLNLCFLWFVIGGVESRGMRAKAIHGLFAGLAGGLALHTGNQMPHLLAGGPVIVWLVWSRQWTLLASMALAYLPVTAIFSIGWTQITQQVSMQHRDVAPDGSGSILASKGFIGAELAWLAAHIKVPTFRQILQDVMSVLRACLWAVPGLAGLALIAPSDASPSGWKVPQKISQSFMASILVSVGLATLFYFFFPLNQGHGWGYRYFQPVLGFFLIASVARLDPGSADSRPVRWLMFASLFSLAAMIPLRSSQIAGFVADRRALLPCARDGESLIAAQICFIDTSAIYWGPDLVQNAPAVTLGQPLKQPLLLRSSGAENDAELVRQLWPDARQASDTDVPGSGSIWLLP